MANAFESVFKMRILFLLLCVRFSEIVQPVPQHIEPDTRNKTILVAVRRGGLLARPGGSADLSAAFIDANCYTGCNPYIGIFRSLCEPECNELSLGVHHSCCSQFVLLDASVAATMPLR